MLTYQGVILLIMFVLEKNVIPTFFEQSQKGTGDPDIANQSIVSLTRNDCERTNH